MKIRAKILSSIMLLAILGSLAGFWMVFQGHSDVASGTSQTAAELPDPAPPDQAASTADVVQSAESNFWNVDLIEKSIRAGVILGFGIVLIVLLKILLRRFEKAISEEGAIRESAATLRLKTLSRVFHWLGTVLIGFGVTYMMLENFGINMAPILAGAGVVGLAFGFGGQSLIRDVISGFFILLEGQYRINDVIRVGELGGLVESITLRVTKLRDLEGRVIYIPNGEIKSVINMTKGFSQALLEIGVAYKEDVDRVMAIIKELGAEMRKDSKYAPMILEDLDMLGVDAFDDSQVTIKFRIKTLPIKQWEIAREFRRRVKNRFDQEGIEIPFPHRTLYWGVGSDNDWMKQSMGARAVRPQS
jgi:moderate conductance mechanosensitive channel